MGLRLTTLNDVDSVMQIIDDAKKYFKVNEIPQWQNGVPSKDTILSDIERGVAYVYEEDDEIIGTLAVFFEDDPNYENIMQGRWLNNSEYAVIHRVAIKQAYKGHGYASNIMKEVELLAKSRGIDNLRIDTHRLNMSMQRLIAKNNFTYCGIVMINDNGELAERLAYQKEI